MLTVVCILYSKNVLAVQTLNLFYLSFLIEFYKDNLLNHHIENV